MVGAVSSCECPTLGDFAVVPMGGDGIDERVLATIHLLADHGGDQWWLYASRCETCGQHWMIAQEERIHDNYYLKRISHDEIELIAEQGKWPNDFLRFEDVIKLGPDNDHVAHFLKTNDLTDTVKELIEKRSEMTAAEVAYLFCLSEPEAARLIDRAREMSWAQLRPFA